MLACVVAGVAAAAVLALVVGGDETPPTSSVSSTTPPTSTADSPCETAGSTRTQIGGSGPYCVDGTCVDGSCILRTRRAPNTAQRPLGQLHEGDLLDISCQVRGERFVAPDGKAYDIWDRLNDGAYVLDYFTTTAGLGTFTPGIPRCR